MRKRMPTHTSTHMLVQILACSSSGCTKPCQCGAGHACTGANHHKKWCYLATGSHCDDATPSTTYPERRWSADACACKCRADHSCRDDNHHTQWCYIGASSICDDTKVGSGGKWSEAACGTPVPTCKDSALAFYAEPYAHHMYKTKDWGSKCEYYKEVAGKCESSSYIRRQGCKKTCTGEGKDRSLFTRGYTQQTFFKNFTSRCEYEKEREYNWQNVVCSPTKCEKRERGCS